MSIGVRRRRGRKTWKESEDDSNSLSMIWVEGDARERRKEG